MDLFLSDPISNVLFSNRIDCSNFMIVYRGKLRNTALFNRCGVFANEIVSQNTGRAKSCIFFILLLLHLHLFITITFI